MPADTKQSKQVYLTLKPKGIDTGGGPQPGRAAKLDVEEMMYAVERDKENYGMANVLSPFEEGGWLAGNSGSDSGVIGNFRSKSVYINLKTPEKQDRGDDRSLQIAEDSSNGWNLLEALKNLSPLRAKKSRMHDMWIEEETGQRAAFQNEVDLDVTSASHLIEISRNENSGGELRRNEMYVSLGSPTITPGKVDTSIVDEELCTPSINTVEELQSSSHEEFMESSNSQTTVLVNYDLETSSTEIAPSAKSDNELLEDVENDVALKDYIFYVQVKPQNGGGIDTNSEITSEVRQNIVSSETGNYHDEADSVTLRYEKLTDPQEETQSKSEILLSSSDSEGVPPVVDSYEQDIDMALRSEQVSQLNVVLSSSQRDDKIEPWLDAEMSGDRYSETVTEGTSERDERRQERYLSGEDKDGLRSSSWISLDNVHVTREEPEVLSSPYLDNEQLDDSVVETVVQPVKSKPLFVTLKPASRNDEKRDASVRSEDGEKSLPPSFREQCEDASQELRPFNSFAVDNVETNEHEETGTSDMEQMEMVHQSGHEMVVIEDVDSKEESADGKEENEIERGQERKQTGITITLKSQAGHFYEEEERVGQPVHEMEVTEDNDADETKELADDREESEIERGQELKRTGITITLNSQTGYIHGGEKMVVQDGHEMEVIEDVDTVETKEFADGREESEIERGQELKRTGITITLNSQTGYIHGGEKMVVQDGHEMEVIEDVDTVETKEFADDREENEIERGQELKQTGITITLKSHTGNFDEEKEMVGQSGHEMEKFENNDADETKEFAEDSEENEVERGQELKQTSMSYITLKLQKAHSHKEVLLQGKSKDDQVTESKDQEQAVDEECEVEEVILNENEGDDESQQIGDDSVKHDSDGQTKEYFGFPSRAEYLRSKISKALRSDTQQYVDQTSIICDNRQEMQVGPPKSERVKELLRRLGRDGKSIKDEIPRQTSENDFGDDCMVADADTDYTKMQTSSISLSLQPVIDQQSKGMVISSVRDGDDREVASDQSTDDQVIEGVQYSQCFDPSSDVGVENQEGIQTSRGSYTLQECIDQPSEEVVVSSFKGEGDMKIAAEQMTNDQGIELLQHSHCFDFNHSTEVEEVLESSSYKEVASALMTVSRGDGSGGDILVPKRDNGDKGWNLKGDQDNARSKTVYIRLKNSDGKQTQLKSDASLTGWQKFLKKEKDIIKVAAAKEKRCVLEESLVSLQTTDDQQTEMVQCSPCLDSSNETVVGEVLRSGSYEEVGSVLVSESRGNQKDEDTLMPEREDGGQTWKRGKDNVKSETVYIRLKTSDERERQLKPADLWSGNQAGIKGTDVDETYQKEKANAGSKSPSKRKLLDFGMKKKFEEFGEHAVGVVSDIAQSGRDLAVSVVKKGKGTPVYPDLREVVLSRLRSREENGDRRGEATRMEENGTASKKVASVRSLFTPEEQRTLANAADSVDAARMMEMMLNLMPDLASRVREAEFEDDTRGQVMKMVDALKEWKPNLKREKSETDEDDSERNRLPETSDIFRQECVEESQTVFRGDITNSRIVEALMRLKLSKEKGETGTEEDAVERSGLLDVLKKIGKQCKDKGGEMHDIGLKVKEEMGGLKLSIGEGDEHSISDDTEALGILETLKDLSLWGCVHGQGAEGEDVDGWRIKEMLMKLRPHFPDRESDRDSQAHDRSSILHVLRKLKGDWPRDDDSRDIGSSGIQEALQMLADDETDGKALEEDERFKFRDILKNLTPDLDLGAWSKTGTDDASKMKDVLMSMKPDFNLRGIGSVKDGLDKSQLSKTLQKLVPDWSFGKNEDSQDPDGDSEMVRVMEMLKKLKPSLDAANVSDDEETSVMETLKKLNIAPRWQNPKVDLRPSSKIGEALGALRSVLAEGGEKANLTVGEFSRMKDALESMMPHWSREHEDDNQGEMSIAIKDALLSLKPNLNGGEEDGENSKIKDLFMKLGVRKGNGSSESHEVEFQEKKVGMLHALREMIAPRRPENELKVELKVQETEENPPEDGVDTLTYEREKDPESREKEWRKVGKLLRNLITFGISNDERNGMVAFLSDDKGESLLMSEKATDLTESRVKEAMMKLKSLDGADEETKMSSLKKSRWLKALIEFMALGDDIEYQPVPSDEGLTTSKMPEVEAVPATSRDVDAVVHETNVEALPSTSPIDRFKAREALQSLNETEGVENQGTPSQWWPWRIFAMSQTSKKKTDGSDSDEVTETEINGRSSRSDGQHLNGGLRKRIDIVGLAHPYITKRMHGSSKDRKTDDKSRRTSLRVMASREQKDENVYMTFKMTYLSGFSPLSSSSRNVIVHDMEVLQRCICIGVPLTAIRNFVMSDADIARKSADGDGFLIISGDGDASMDVEVQEDIVASKVGDQEEKSGREEVNMDELADMLNGDEVQVDAENEEEPEPEGEVVTEEQIAEVKVGGVEAGISIQWPGGEEEQTEEAADDAETEKVEETEEVKVSENIEEVENVEVVENDEEENEVTQKEEELLIDVQLSESSQKEEELLIDVQLSESSQKQEELLIDVQVNGEATEINEEVKEDVNVDDEVKKETEEEVVEDSRQEDESPVSNVAIEVTLAEEEKDQVNVEEVEKPTEEEVVEDNKQDESPAGNVAIEVTLGEKVEEKKAEKEEVTEKVPHVREGRVAKSLLSDRIRAFENKNKENEPVISQSKRSSSKLDNTKIIKYQGSVDEQDGEPVKPVKGTGRLDMSRFSLFQKKSEGSEPPKKNFTIKPVTNKNRFGIQEDGDDAEPKGPSSTDASNKCHICEKRVYPMEKITADGKSYHQSCFRCTECKKVLSLGTYAQINSLIFCKPHFKQRFKLHGNYNTGFSQGASLRSPSTADGQFPEFSPDKTGVSDEIAATQAQTTESTPVVREDLVRSSDPLDDKRSVEGGTKSILERFKQGPVSNVEVKRTIDEENVNVRSLEDYQPPPREVEEDTHIKPQDMIDTDRDEGQSAESQPQEAREDIVRSNQDFEEVRASVGLKNLKSMFEKGGVSNVEVRVQREKIEVKPLGEVEESEAKAVAENVPQSQKADVVSGGTQEEDPGIKLGLAQKMRAQFEKGNVSNIEEKPRPDLERTPKSLDDFGEEQSTQASQSVSESTPQRRDDVVRSDVPLEEQSHLAEGTRSLLSRWEKGEVEHAEEKPKENLSEPKDFKDVIQVSESTPQVRDDLVRESDQLDESVPEGVTKNLAGNLEGGAEFSVEVGIREEVDEEEESTPKRLSEGEDNPEIMVSIEVNGNVSPGENGHSDGLETTPNGHYENDVESPEADPSLEIKAARAAALEDQDDEGDSTMLVDSR